MSGEQEQACSLDDGLEADMDGLNTEELEQILADLMVVKYPGIEQVDIDRFLRALHRGVVSEVERIEADIAVKSARWQLAAFSLNR